MTLLEIWLVGWLATAGGLAAKCEDTPYTSKKVCWIFVSGVSVGWPVVAPMALISHLKGEE